MTLSTCALPPSADSTAAEPAAAAARGWGSLRRAPPRAAPLPSSPPAAEPLPCLLRTLNRHSAQRLRRLAVAAAAVVTAVTAVRSSTMLSKS